MTEDEAMTILNALGDIYKPPYNLLEHVLKGICSFNKAHFPKEISTEDDPPVKLDKGMDIISIDGLLGLYSSGRKKIIIYKKGIREVSEILRVKPLHLECIVRIHEWAHAILHLGVAENDRLKILKDDSYWSVVQKASTKMFKGVEPDLHEILA